MQHNSLLCRYIYQILEILFLHTMYEYMKKIKKIALVFTASVLVVGCILAPKPIFYTFLDEVSLSSLEPNEKIVIDYNFGHWSFYGGKVIFTEKETRFINSPQMKIRNFLKPYYSSEISLPRTMVAEAKRREELDVLIDRVVNPCETDRDYNSIYGNAKITLHRPWHLSKAVHVNDYDGFIGSALHCLGLEQGECGWSTSFSRWGVNAKENCRKSKS